MQVEVIRGAEEFSLGEGPVGALLVHGFTGSPQSLRALGEHLAERGLRVSGVRLPGHGTTWQDCNTCNADDWRTAVAEAFDVLAAECDEVWLVGLSFGGSLVLDFARANQDRIAGIVTLAGFVQTKDPRRHLAPILRHVLSSLPGVANDIADPESRELAYDRFPVKAGYWMLRMVDRARAALPHINRPILVMHGRNDHTVLPFNAQLIYDNVASADKELVWLENSYHVITVDVDREQLYDKTFEFIKQRSAHAL